MDDDNDEKNIAFGCMYCCMCRFMPFRLTQNSQNTEFDPNDTGTWFDETSGAQIDILDVEKLKTGMTFDETVDLLGKPKRDIGSGVVIMEWDMVSGAHLNVFFVKQISGNSQNETTAESLIIEKWRIKE